MARSTPEVIYGAAAVAQLSKEQLTDYLNVLQKHNPDSELTLGKHDVPKTFVIHTKAPALKPACMSKQSVLDGMAQSLKDLGVDSVDLYYLHGPDPTTPIEETLSAIQELYASGKFKRFGVSNYQPQDVQKIYDIQAAAHSVLPSVFQGNYNAVSRHIESDLFPLLRKLQISFYAYSPIAGGFLVKESSQLRTNEVEGRFSGKTPLGDMYQKLYGKESLYEALDEWGIIAKEAGVSKAALAYRWIMYHSALEGEKGDGIIVGASNIQQLEQTLATIEEGPLKEETAKKAGAIWEKVKGEAPRDNWTDYFALKL